MKCIYDSSTENDLKKNMQVIGYYSNSILSNIYAGFISSS